MNGEHRVVDPNTGGEKGSKSARFDLIPADVEWLLAEHYGKGSEKYEDRNWERGYKWSLSYAALRRHLNAFWSGEEFDADGNSHIVAVMWHAAALTAFQNRGIGTDDRPTIQPAPAADFLMRSTDTEYADRISGVHPISRGQA